MSVELREVRKRIGVTRQIRKMTGAMQRVASVRLVNDRRAVENSRRYAERLTGLVRELTAVAADVGHPLLALKPPGPVMVIVFGSERGLCGGFNAGLMNKALAFVRSDPARPARFTVIGKATHRKARRMGLDVGGYLPPAPQPARASLIDEITERITDAFLKGETSEVYVLYSRFVSGLRQTLTVERILPVSLTPADGAPWNAALFEPGAEQILLRLLPESVRQSIAQAFLNSAASESAARQMAMGRATENAGEMLEDLMASHRRLRQQRVTTQILELMGREASGR